MIDLEFIMSNRNSFKRCIIYSYISSAFKFEVTEKIKSVFDFRGILLNEADYSSFLDSCNGLSLFGESLILIDLEKFKGVSKSWVAEFDKFCLDFVAERLENRFVVFGLQDSFDGLNNSKNFIEFKDKSSLIEEAPPEKLSASIFLDYISFRNKNAFDLTKVKNSDTMYKSIGQILKSKELDIFEIISLCEECLFVALNNDKFDAVLSNLLINNVSKQDNFILYDLVFNVLATGSKISKDRLYKYLLELNTIEEFSVELISYRFMKVYKDFLYINVEYGPSEEYLNTLNVYYRKYLGKFKDIKLHKLFRVGMLLAIYESLLNSNNLTTLLYEFVAML